MKQKQRIVISAFCEGKSKKQIARDTGLNIKTVRRYISNYEEALSRVNTAVNESEIRVVAESIVEIPKYDISNRRKRKLTQDIIEKIEVHLRENEEKRRNRMHKQQKRKIDIHDALAGEGIEISYGTVSTAINKILGNGNEAFIKSEYDNGEICEFDWGDVKLKINNKIKSYHMAVFTGAKGNYRYATVFPKQDTECFIESHALFFDHIKGVYRTMVYDNMKVAVRKFVGISEKEPTEALLKLSVYYGFKFRFCNVRAGNEKGHVERSVDYIRHKAFSHRQEFISMDEANEYLLEVCNNLNCKMQKYKENKSALEILDEERPYLLKNMPIYDAAKTIESRVDKYSTISYGTCHYSVPEELVGQMIFTKIYSNMVICFKDGVKVAEYRRLHGFNEWVLNIEHFLKTLRKKPGALATSTVMHQADPTIKNIYNKYFIKKEKEFIELLQFISSNGIDLVLNSIKSLEKLSPLDISLDKIKLLCKRTEIIPMDFLSITQAGNNSEITENSIQMLNLFKDILPDSSCEFIKGVPM